jgi:hypothetical protein
MRDSSGSTMTLRSGWLMIWSRPVELLVRPLNRMFRALPNADIIGIKITNQPALMKWESGQGNIGSVCHLVANFSLKDA